MGEQPEVKTAEEQLQELMQKLSAKFDPQDIEWRVQSAGVSNNGKPWAMVIPYITNRAIMQRLDDVVPGSWRDEYKASPCNTGYLCGISIKINGEWVTRWDGATYEGNGGIDAVKSTCSNAQKRAGVKWGIGRYLYQLEEAFANCVIVDNRNQTPAGWTFQKSSKQAKAQYKMAWQPPTLPDWAMPKEDSSQYLMALKNSQSMEELKHYWKQFYNLAKSLNDLKLMDQGESVKNELKLKLEKAEVDKAERQAKEFKNWLEGRIALALDVENQAGRKAFIEAIKQDIPTKCMEYKQSKKEALTTLNNMVKGN